MNYEDLIFIVYILYEGLLILFLGPDFSSLNPVFFNFGGYILF